MTNKEHHMNAEPDRLHRGNAASTFAEDVFAKVAELGSFRRAGLVMGLRASVTSSTVRDLEARHRVPLLQRVDGLLRVTDAGDRLLRRREAGHPSRSEPGGLHGDVAIDLDPFEARRSVVETLERLQATHRRLRIRLTTTRRPLAPWPDALHVAIRLDEDDRHREALTLCEYDTVTCAAPAYLSRRGMPKSPQELRNHDLLPVLDPRSERPRPFRFAGHAGARTVAPRRYFGVADAGMALRAALDGCGIAQLPVNDDVRTLLSRRALVAVLAGTGAPRIPLRLLAAQPSSAAISVVSGTLSDFYLGESLSVSRRREP
jgi:DNA-binding transcriptional LysR family regulator